MLTEQQLSDDEFTALLPLLEAYPNPADLAASDLVTCLQKETVLPLLSLLGCEVVFTQGFLLCPCRQLVEAHEEEYIEIQVIDLKELLPANERFVINTVHCTMALLTCQDGHVRMKQEELFTPRQLSLLLPTPPPVLTATSTQISPPPIGCSARQRMKRWRDSSSRKWRKTFLARGGIGKIAPYRGIL